jgi:hypothetical protein
MDGGTALLFLESCAAVKGNQTSPHCRRHFLVRLLFALSAYVRRLVAFSEFHLQRVFVAFGGNTFSAAGYSRKFRQPRYSSLNAVSSACNYRFGLPTTAQGKKA